MRYFLSYDEKRLEKSTLKLIFHKKAQKWHKNDKNNFQKCPEICRLWHQRRDSYGSIPSYWPLRMSNILLSSLELPQDELSATLSSPLALLTGLKTTQSLLWRHSRLRNNLQTCSDFSCFVIFMHLCVCVFFWKNEFMIRFSLVFFHHMTTVPWTTEVPFKIIVVLYSPTRQNGNLY